MVKEFLKQINLFSSDHVHRVAARNSLLAPLGCGLWSSTEVGILNHAVQCDIYVRSLELYADDAWQYFSSS